MPSMTRPRLKTDCEERLAAVDRRDAAKYASMETLTHQFNAVADRMQAEEQEERDAIPQSDEEWEDSMVHNIEAVRAKLVAG